jgi:hypothetical protein
MTLARASLLVCLLAFSLAHGENPKRWPADAGENDTTIDVPSEFSAVAWQTPAMSPSGKDAPLLLGVRFRSADGKAEFAVAVYYVRHIPSDPDARRISVLLSRGEKAAGTRTDRKKIAGENGDYWLYDEETTVTGDGYTRYLLNSFSTSRLPGATSIQWEFRAADEDSRKRRAAAYRRFKDSLITSED